LHITGVLDKSAPRFGAICMRVVGAHPGERIGAGPPGWGTSGRTAGSTRGWMGAHAPITALRAGGKSSGGDFRLCLLSFAPITALAAARAVGRGRRWAGSIARNGRNRQQIPAGGRPCPHARAPLRWQITSCQSQAGRVSWLCSAMN